MKKLVLLVVHCEFALVQKVTFEGNADTILSEEVSAPLSYT